MGGSGKLGTAGSPSSRTASSRIAYSKVPSEDGLAFASNSRRILRSSSSTSPTPCFRGAEEPLNASSHLTCMVGRASSSEEEELRKACAALPWYHKNRLRFYTFHECPKYLQDNDFIIGYYRGDIYIWKICETQPLITLPVLIANYTFTENWISLFFFHNEFANVWTHLISFALFIGVLFDIALWTGKVEAMYGLDYLLSVNDRLVLSGFIVGTAIGFMCSSMFHLHLSCNERVFKFFGCLDYSG